MGVQRGRQQGEEKETSSQGQTQGSWKEERQATKGVVVPGIGSGKFPTTALIRYTEQSPVTNWKAFFFKEPETLIDFTSGSEWAWSCEQKQHYLVWVPNTLMCNDPHATPPSVPTGGQAVHRGRCFRRGQLAWNLIHVGARRSFYSSSACGVLPLPKDPKILGACWHSALRQGVC